NSTLQDEQFPFKLKVTKTINAEGKPFVQNASINGQEMASNKLPQIIDQQGNIIPEAIGGPGATANPLNSQVKLNYTNIKNQPGMEGIDGVSEPQTVNAISKLEGGSETASPQTI